ncbi:ribosome maturation factor RimP [Cyanobacterium aponinum AL20118]|uniref:Ribosome maturation factor RimP n=1 Tax=Cyanobacterium aponinum AL20115 TaxID=3090662 RepID=A0AAF0ZD37_9CHRO|nr:ribosome maturation factor RimP [Cyanobacterium aponinum]WPF90156.1 ribosome maturation factor RimP [Cyanobacterium aponinum AL20115]
MTHPLIPSILELAEPLAQKLNLEIANIVFQTNKNPPVLRIDIKSVGGDTSLDDCEKMSRQLEEILDVENTLPSTYVLEISSPGIGNNLESDREFISFKGFPVIVETNTIFKKKNRWEGTLQGRDDQFVYVNCKGKITKIPRDIIQSVQLHNPS